MTRITMVVILRSLFSDAVVWADEEDAAAAAVHVLGLIGMREMY